MAKSKRKKIYLVLGSEKSGRTFQKVSHLSNHESAEVGILGVDGEAQNSASLLIVTYEGAGAFSIRSPEGSRITIRGGKPQKPFVVD